MSPRTWLPLALLLLGGTALLLATSGPSRAQEEDGKHIVYLSVTGEGPTAKAWYKGAPPAGVPIQDALDTFSGQGYHVSEIRPYTRQPIVVLSTDTSTIQSMTSREEYFVILLER